MTTANKITIFRILLIPFFVVEVLYYMKTGNETHRLSAILAFGIAAICDGVDGYIARRYNQRSELGAILDPLADKQFPRPATEYRRACRGALPARSVDCNGGGCRRSQPPTWPRAVADQYP